MEYEEKFKDILNSDETVVKVYKPNKLKYWVAKGLYIFLVACLFALLVWSLSFMETTESVDAPPTFNLTIFAVTLSISLVLLIVIIVYLIYFYKNLYYCITSQRVIIRRGVFGTDYKTLDMQMIGATNVRVSLLDKMVRRNTGSIVFGSNSAPMISQGSVFIFRDIVDPYKESKDIKTTIDASKAAKSTSPSTEK